MRGRSGSATVMISQRSSTVQLLVADIMPKTTERFKSFFVCCVFFLAIVLITSIHPMAFVFKSLLKRSKLFLLHVCYYESCGERKAATPASMQAA